MPSSICKEKDTAKFDITGNNRVLSVAIPMEMDTANSCDSGGINMRTLQLYEKGTQAASKYRNDLLVGRECNSEEGKKNKKNNQDRPTTAIFVYRADQ